MPHGPLRPQQTEDRVVRLLRAVVPIKQRRRLSRPPRLRISNTPLSNPDTLLHIQTRLHHSGVIRRVRILDIKLCDRDLTDTSTRQERKCALSAPSTTGAQVGLRADTVDGDALRDPRLDFVGETLRLGVVGRVEVVVVDVQFGVRIGFPRRFEGDADEVLTQDVVEDALAETSVLCMTGSV